MDVKLLSEFGSVAATAGIVPHCRIYDFFYHIDMLENSWGKDKYNQSIRRYYFAKGHRTPSIPITEGKLEDWLELKQLQAAYVS